MRCSADVRWLVYACGYVLTNPVRLGPSQPEGWRKPQYPCVHKYQGVETFNALFHEEAGEGLQNKSQPASLALKPPQSVQGGKVEKMNIAVRKVHVVFDEYAMSSPRFLAIAAGAALMHELQLDVYRMGARSPTVVENRARLARSFFMDVETYQWRADCITPFQIAKWLHGRIAGGTKTVSIYAAATLRLVQAASEWIMHYTHPLVVGQIRSVVGGKSEPSVPARTPSVDFFSKLEALVFTGATVQIR